MTKQIVVKNDLQETPAYISFPQTDGKSSAIILIHEVWGLTDHIKDVADRFAAQGFVVLAPDLFAGSGIEGKVDASLMTQIFDAVTKAEAQKKLRAAMTPIMQPEFGAATVQKLKDSFNYLAGQPEVNGKISVVGFCFGGTYAFSLAAAEPRLKSAVAFYGHAPEDENILAKTSCPIMAFYGDKDENLMQKLPQLETSMKNLKKHFSYKVYPGAGHAFFNDTNPITYSAEVAKDAWTKTLEFLRQ